MITITKRDLWDHDLRAWVWDWWPLQPPLSLYHGLRAWIWGFWRRHRWLPAWFPTGCPRCRRRARRVYMVCNASPQKVPTSMDEALVVN